MKKYSRITPEERLLLKTYLDDGYRQSEIAVKLGRNKSSISREISRNSGMKGYRHKQAQKKAEARQEWRKSPRKLNDSLITTIEALIRKDWSPETISNRLRLEKQPSVCHETIYRHIYRDYKNGGSLFSHLRFAGKTRKPRFPRDKTDRRGQIRNARCISTRTAGAENGSRVGRVERDTMLGKDRSSGVLLMVDRKNRNIKLGKLENHTASKVLRKTLELAKDMKVISFTNDRGKEFSKHKELSDELNVPVYFCHAYTSQEKGTAENRMGILRKYLPKGTCLKKITDKELKVYEDIINNTHMKCLDWRTPYEKVTGKNVALAM